MTERQMLTRIWWSVWLLGCANLIATGLLAYEVTR